MRTYIILLITLLPLFAFSQSADIRCAIITGGHKFEREAFFEVYEEMDHISYQEVTQPEANQFLLTDFYDDFDLLIFYDMMKVISDEELKALIKLAKKGKPMLFMHHAVAAYNNKELFTQLLGATWVKRDTSIAGQFYPKTTYLHDTEVRVYVEPEASDHPILKGISDFTIIDETYKKLRYTGSREVLLTTDHPEGDKDIMWLRKLKRSEIAYLQLGHDGKAYGNPNYQKLVSNTIDYLVKEK